MNWIWIFKFPKRHFSVTLIMLPDPNNWSDPLKGPPSEKWKKLNQNQSSVPFFVLIAIFKKWPIPKFQFSWYFSIFFFQVSILLIFSIPPHFHLTLQFSQVFPTEQVLLHSNFVPSSSAPSYWRCAISEPPTTGHFRN